MVVHERVVEEEEGLRGHDRLAALGDDRAGVGAIEQAAEVGGRELGPVRTDIRYKVRRGTARSAKAGPPRRALQAAGHGQEAVADGLRIEPPTVHPPEQAILRVRGESLGLDAAALLVGRRQHDEPVHRLQGPARLHEARGQEVEQFGVRRPVAPAAEIVGGADQSLAEVMLPDPIDHHAGRQGMIGARQPVGQLPPAAPLGDPRRRVRPSGCEESPAARSCRASCGSPQEDLGVLEALVTRPLGAAVPHGDRLGDLRARASS